MTDSIPALSRRYFLLTAAGASIASETLGKTRPRTPTNPLIRQRADAQIFRHDDGYYYFTATVPEYDRLILRRSRDLAGLSLGGEVVIWRRPKSGKLAGYIWAPELHHFDGQWHLYFGAGNGDDLFHVRTYVISSPDENPLTARWSAPVRVEMPWDSFTLDATSFVHRNTRYLCWAQHEDGIDTNSNIYLAPLASASTFAAAPVRLTVPSFEWETVKYKVAEAPTVLIRHDRLFLTYSASATDANYCLGMLTAHADSNIMTPTSWVKSPQPVFKSSPQNKVWGPGHNSFTVDENGRDILVYHGRDYAQISGDSLFDPNRHTRLQYFGFHADGTPDFGEPVANGPCFKA